MNLLTTTIDLDAIAHNTRLLKRMAGGAQLMCVVKADGYNHGAAPVAATMAAHGADQFGVATLAEAVALREAGITQPILAWMWQPDQNIEAALEAGIELGVPSLAHIRRLADEGVVARVSLKLDTAMNRSGVDPTDWDAAFSMLAAAPNLTVTGLFSHFACADEPDNPLNNQQIAAMNRAISAARAAGLEVPVNHLANSPALLTRPDSFFEMVRPGIAVYGCNPVPGLATELRPAMTWESRVTVVKPIQAGEGVSYGQTWRAPSDGFTAVVACGYADGLPRAMQGGLEVTIGDSRYPQVGRVCMDQIVVWLGEGGAPEVHPGDRAILFGPGTDGEMTADDFAAVLGTINYEVICSPHGRTTRTYLGG
ncbi:alanine racemase [Corynebacterium sp.]|uniref:alanine racemase n=1 Tax=Corynebacterium sp. TaxID=1720 RepID=UPI0026DDCC6E|nr:alanine racemase [Corynebacterium sp.]MDO5077081.1 alanine racemase [Corynebacterium sp.]